MSIYRLSHKLLNRPNAERAKRIGAPRRKPRHDEDRLQKACVQLLDYQAAMGRLKFSAVPLGGKRGKTEAARLKGLGARAGAPDIFIAMADGRTIYLELKSPDGKLSKEQREWRDFLLSHGHQWFLIRDVMELAKIIG